MPAAPPPPALVRVASMISARHGLRIIGDVLLIIVDDVSDADQLVWHESEILAEVKDLGVKWLRFRVRAR